jgi:hypothetical protein
MKDGRMGLVYHPCLASSGAKLQLRQHTVADALRAAPPGNQPPTGQLIS